MKRMGVLLAGLLLAVFNTGCASYMVARGSQERVMQRRAIHAHQVDGGVAMSVDLLSLDVLGERPWMQAGAALLDAAMIYGTYEALDRIVINSDRSSTRDDQSTRSEVAITGDGNTIIIQSGAGTANRDTTLPPTGGGE